MKNITSAKTSAPKFVSDTQVQVTKQFAKNAMIFGTPEYKLWRAIKEDCPDAKMVTKSIKKSDKPKYNQNRSYDNMLAFINTLSERDRLTKEFDVVKARAKIQAYPYKAVLDWFEARVMPLGNYEDFIGNEVGAAEANVSAAS